MNNQYCPQPGLLSYTEGYRLFVLDLLDMVIISEFNLQYKYVTLFTT